MKKFREWIAQWLEGRYGCDGLSVLYLCLAVMIAVCAHGHMSGVTQTFWYIAACVLAAYAIYRCFSRDAAKQQRQ